MTFKFEIIKESKKSKARVGKLYTAHGVIDTPVFMPVGTQATVKTMSPRDLNDIESQIILANTYHLLLRPGPELIKEAGGLHKFMRWDKPILTDSGGFQVYSLSLLRKVKDDGVEFTSHVDGKKHYLTPKKVLGIESAIGADIVMPLDECTPYPCSKKEAKTAVERTTKWAKKSQEEQQVLEKHQTLFGIVQGNMFKDLRKRSAEELAELNFPGYGIGGVSVGEPQDKMFEVLDVVTDILPKDTPKHLMGVGFADDITGAVKLGADMFDCVIPTRLARHGTFMTFNGRFGIRNRKFEKDFTPLDPDCDCYACRTFSKAYIRHIFWAREILAMQLISLHNLRFYTRLMKKIREDILAE